MLLIDFAYELTFTNEGETEVYKGVLTVSTLFLPESIETGREAMQRVVMRHCDMYDYQIWGLAPPSEQLRSVDGGFEACVISSTRTICDIKLRVHES